MTPCVPALQDLDPGLLRPSFGVTDQPQTQEPGSSGLYQGALYRLSHIWHQLTVSPFEANRTIESLYILPGPNKGIC